MRRDSHLKVHDMFCTWASHLAIQLGTSEGQGYSIGDMREYAGMPATSKIPKGIEYTTPEDIAITNFLQQTTYKYREYCQIKYLEGKQLSPYKHKDLLAVACKWLFG